MTPAAVFIRQRESRWHHEHSCSSCSLLFVLSAEVPSLPGSHCSSIRLRRSSTGGGPIPNLSGGPAPATRETLHCCDVHNHGGRSPAKLPDVRSARVDDMRHFTA